MKKLSSILSLSLFLFVSLQFAAGRSAQEAVQEPETDRITVTGRLRLVGNEPFTRFSIKTGEGKNYILEDVSREEWTNELGRKVTISGFLETRTLKSADKTKTFIENIILDAELVK